MPRSIRNTSRSARNRARRLRKEMTETERLLWRHLRRKSTGFRFRRQYPIGPYIVDFYCDEARLAVEVDGEFHAREDRKDRDIARDQSLRDRRVETIRVRTVDVIESLEAVLEIIQRSCCERSGRRAFADVPPPR